MSRIHQWSFSRWKDYDTCPAKIKYRYIDKLPSSAGPAAERGTLIHKKAEDYVNGLYPELPSELSSFRADFKWLKARKAICEEEWAFTREWQPTDWTAPDAWLRMKLDARVVSGSTCVVIDHKTGKQRDEHRMQLGLYAMATFIMAPEVENVNAKLWYLDLGKTTEENYVREELDLIKEVWEERVGPMMADEDFAPKPNFLCRYCDYSKDRGGPCPM